MSMYGTPSVDRPPLTTYPGWSLELVDADTFQSWTIGQQLKYTLLIEANSPQHNHKELPTFLDLMNNLSAHIVDEESITREDTQKIFDIIVKENKSNYMCLVLNNKLLPNSNYDGHIAIKSLKQAIRLNSLDIVRFMIKENVTIGRGLDSFDDIKSLIFNVLRSVEVSSNNSSYKMANMFWNYLAKCFYESYKNDNNEWDKQSMINADDDNYNIRYSKFFIKNPLIQYAIFKKIHASSIGKHYINKLSPILHFICEHFMLFDDKQNLNDLYNLILNDKVFNGCNGNANGLIKFNIKGVELFWSEYLSIKLINDYLGINVLNKYRKIKENERNKILDTIKYLISNGVGKNLNDIVIPILNKDGYINHKDIANVLNAIKYGKNIWNIKILQKEEMLLLFANCCNEQIQIPYSLCVEILSFVVL